MAVTLRREPQELQVIKYSLFSPLLSSVSGDLHVLQVTYSTALQSINVTLNDDLIFEGLTDISSQHVLDLLLLEATLDNQTPAPINGTTRTQFSEQV